MADLPNNQQTTPEVVLQRVSTNAERYVYEMFSSSFTEAEAAPALSPETASRYPKLAEAIKSFNSGDINHSELVRALYLSLRSPFFNSDTGLFRSGPTMTDANGFGVRGGIGDAIEAMAIYKSFEVFRVGVTQGGVLNSDHGPDNVDRALTQIRKGLVQEILEAEDFAHDQSGFIDNVVVLEQFDGMDTFVFVGCPFAVTDEKFSELVNKLEGKLLSALALRIGISEAGDLINQDTPGESLSHAHFDELAHQNPSLVTGWISGLIENPRQPEVEAFPSDVSLHLQTDNPEVTVDGQFRYFCQTEGLVSVHQIAKLTDIRHVNQLLDGSVDLNATTRNELETLAYSLGYKPTEDSLDFFPRYTQHPVDRVSGSLIRPEKAQLMTSLRNQYLDAKHFYVELDVGNLGNLNTTLGPAVADQVFTQIAAIVKLRCNAVGVPFQAARVGGDEFALFAAVPPDKEVEFHHAMAVLPDLVSGWLDELGYSSPAMDSLLPVQQIAPRKANRPDGTGINLVVAEFTESLVGHEKYFFAQVGDAIDPLKKNRSKSMEQLVVEPPVARRPGGGAASGRTSMWGTGAPTFTSGKSATLGGAQNRVSERLFPNQARRLF